MTRRIAVVLLVMVVGGLAGAAGAGAATFTVNTMTDSSDGSCSPALGACSLRDAVEAADGATTASTISVPVGTYSLTIASTGLNDPTSGDLDITAANPVTIVGAGAGSTIIDPSLAPDRAFAVASGASLTLRGVTVHNGSPAASSSGSQDGGAIYADGALSLSGDAFTGNHGTGGYGGAIYADPADTSPLTVRSTAFTSNTAANRGGAIADDGTGVLTFTGDTFGTDSSDGNSGGQQGGAVYDSSSSAATIDDSSFSNNQAAAADNGGHFYGGGALWLSGHSYTLQRDAFTANVAGNYGGAIMWTAGALSSYASSFVGNRATAFGGAIFASATQPFALTDATMSANTGSAGGGIYFTSSTPVDLVNDTLYDDAAPGGSGNEIYGTAALTANTVGVQNTVLGNDGTSQYGAQPNCADTGGANPLPVGVDLGHNLSTDGSCLSAAPGDLPVTTLTLGAPADNGGTVLTDAEPAGQPSIDAGTNTVCPGLDARGAARPQGAACDIGADEFVPPPTPPASTTTTVTTTTVTTSAPMATAAAGSPPSATTRGVMGIAATSVFLGGTIDPHGLGTSYRFQVGTTKAYGVSSVTGYTDVGPLTIETRITGLKASTHYHYRLVASSVAGTRYGADRTFTTAPAYDGAVKVGATTLTVHGGKVAVPLKCVSVKACVLRLTVTIAARLARTHRLGTLSFTQTTNPLVTLPAHRTTTVSAKVNPAALALLEKAPHHRLAGKLSTRPRTSQLGVIAAVTLALR